ncbi:hypothetical protein TNCV_5085691 [Trichonephila clavipes]|uniref:Uncharacterized protein n=1 Tax=Trichonephila clavipes TaxID=2585209 RepID=A0A8X6VCC1_TRICX|nr:hypothetical protein TNCV_5085691 [Trichonephila clavipes]
MGELIHHKVIEKTIRFERVEPTLSLAAVQRQAVLHYGPPCTFPHHRKAPGCRTFGITCAANDTHPSTPAFRVVSLTTRLDWNGIELGRLQRRF